jgi:hypothetical protein
MPLRTTAQRDRDLSRLQLAPAGDGRALDQGDEQVSERGGVAPRWGRRIARRSDLKGDAVALELEAQGDEPSLEDRGEIEWPRRSRAAWLQAPEEAATPLGLAGDLLEVETSPLRRWRDPREMRMSHDACERIARVGERREIDGASALARACLGQGREPGEARHALRECPHAKARPHLLRDAQLEGPDLAGRKGQREPPEEATDLEPHEVSRRAGQELEQPATDRNDHTLRVTNHLEGATIAHGTNLAAGAVTAQNTTGETRAQAQVHQVFVDATAVGSLDDPVSTIHAPGVKPP